MHLNIFTVQKKCYAALAIEDWQDREYFSKFGGGYYITVYVSYKSQKRLYILALKRLFIALKNVNNCYYNIGKINNNKKLKSVW